jgi:hypothetical protein
VRAGSFNGLNCGNYCIYIYIYIYIAIGYDRKLYIYKQHIDCNNFTLLLLKARDLRAAGKSEVECEPSVELIRWLEGCDAFHKLMCRL